MSEISSAPFGPRPFIKMHGLGNDFVIVDARKRAFAPGADDIRRICDRHFGVGADQLVVIEPSERATAFMRLFNVDGREVGACGNATRCVAWLLLEEGATDAVAIETLAGVLDSRRAGDLSVTCDMGPVSTSWRDVPLSREVDTSAIDVDGAELGPGTALNVGNPQVVFFVERLDDVDLASVAPPIQANELFPEGVNVGVAERTGPSSLRLAVYERGAGLTLACGTGACAAAFAATARGIVDPGPVDVDLPGGRVRIELTDGRAHMTGPVAHTFRGEF